MTKAQVGFLLTMVLVSAGSFGQSFNKVQYFKPAAAEAERSQVVWGNLRFSPTDVQFANAKGDAELTIANSAVKSLSYEPRRKPLCFERCVNAIEISREAAIFTVPAVLPFMLVKSTKHMLTIQHADANGADRFTVVQLDKRNYRQVIAALEAGTGKTVQMPAEKASNKK